MHAEMSNRPSTIRPWLDRIGVPVFVSAVAVVVLLATAVWLTQPWNSGTTDQSILPLGSVAHASGGEPVEAADATVGPDLDKNWCENADGHYHELGPVMHVMYGQPESSDRWVDPPPGHSMQVMEIICASEDWLSEGKRGTTVWMSPDSPWYGQALDPPTSIPVP